MIWLEFEFGYDKETNELIIFEYGEEIARFDYDLEDDPKEIVGIDITHMGTYEDGELICINKLE